MRIAVFGGLDAEYARNRVLRLGLERLGATVALCTTSPRRRGLARMGLLAARFARMARPDVLLVPEFRHKDVPLARLLATLAGCDLVVDPLVSRWDTKVGDWGSVTSSSLQAAHNARLDRAAVRFADLLLCDTPGHARWFQERYRVPPERCAVVPVGFDDTVFTPLPPPPAGPFTVAFYGSYLPLHGIETVLEAAKRLRGEGIRFLLVGGGQTFPAVRVACAAGLDLDVRDRMAPSELVRELAAAHVLLGIFGTTSKAARVVPNKVYQGLALGRALVTADTPALRDFFVPGEHLLAVPPGDGAALADALRRLRRDAALCDRVARAGCRFVHAAYGPEAVARRLLDAGQRVLGWEVPRP